MSESQSLAESILNYTWDFPEQPKSLADLKREGVPPHIFIAYQFGLIKIGYTVQDYLVEAVLGPPEQRGRSGYETALVWAVQGSGKSSRCLQFLYWLYGDWDRVLDNLVFRPQDFIDHLEKVPDDETIPGILWDDIMVHFPASTFKTNIKQYEAVDSTFASVRTKVNVILASLPIVDRCAKNIKDNATLEVFLGRNQLEAVFRLYRLPGLKSIESNFFKIQLQQFEKFNLFDVPLETWRKYWTHRVRLTKEAIEALKSTTDMGADPSMIPILKAVTLYTEGTGRKISANTIQQMGSRGILTQTKIKGKLHVSINDLNELIANDLKSKKMSDKV